MADQAHPRKMSYDWIGFETQNAKCRLDLVQILQIVATLDDKKPLSEADYINDDAIVDEILTLLAVHFKLVLMEMWLTLTEKERRNFILSLFGNALQQWEMRCTISMANFTL